MCLHAIGNALQFLLIFGIDMRPQHLSRSRAEEFPIALCLMHVEQLDRLKRISNFRREKYTSARKPISNGDRADMYICPSALLKAIRLLQPGVS